MSNQAAIARVHAAIYASWRRFVSDAQATAEADRFVSRFMTARDDGHLTDDDFDRLLERVAAAVADASPRIAVRIAGAAVTIRNLMP